MSNRDPSDRTLIEPNAGPPRIEPTATPSTPAGARYEPIKVIGEGGMGQIVLSRDRDLQRKVAVKLLHPEFAKDPDISGRFLKEVQITAQLDHPNVIPVYGLEVAADGTISYAMKLIEGITLGDVIDDARKLHTEGRPLDETHSLASRLDVFLKVCDAVSYAHSKGVLHRDLKPPNVMIGPYREVYVMDWGVARLMDGHDEVTGAVKVELKSGTAGADATQAGQYIGTPRYMSPEQAEGKTKELDGRSDEYALGLILHELVTLQRAVPGDSIVETLVHAQNATRAPLVHADAKERIPGELAAIIDKATDQNRDERYAGVAELAADVRRYLRGEAVLARPDTPLQQLLRAMARHREWTLAVLMALLLAGVMAFTWSEQRRAAARRAADDHELKVKDLLSAVSRQGQRIDARFLRLEGALEGLATAAIGALTHDATSDEPIYTGTDFDTPGSAPPDFGALTGRVKRQSLDFPVSVIPPGTTRDALLPQLRRLGTLRRHLRRLFLESVPEGREPLPPDRERALLTGSGLALDFAYVVTAEGVLHMFPGTGDWEPGYDPRQSGYYTLSAHKYGRFWGNPYVDANEDSEGDDLILPCTTSIYDAAGTFLGVAGVEMTFARIIDQLLKPDGLPVLETTLLDDQGRKIVDSGDHLTKFKAAKTDAGVDLVDFRIPEIVAAVKEKRTGTIELTRGGKHELIAFHRLDMKGWYYIVEVDAEAYLGK